MADLPLNNGAWKPATPEVEWSPELVGGRLDGETWPDEIVLLAWEHNDAGERRIKARQSYRLSQQKERDR